jgi:hypothetical protein
MSVAVNNLLNPRGVYGVILVERNEYKNLDIDESG